MKSTKRVTIDNGNQFEKRFCGDTLDVEKHTNKEKRTFKSVSLGAREKLWIIYFGRKVVCSFAFHIEIDLPNHGTSFSTLGKPPMITGIPS